MLLLDNNVQVGCCNGFNPSPSAAKWVGTLKAVTGEAVVVSFYGVTNQLFRWVGDTLPDTIPVHLGWADLSTNGNMAVWRWSYNDTVVYSTSLSSGVQPYCDVYYNTTGQFEIVNLYICDE